MALLARAAVVVLLLVLGSDAAASTAPIVRIAGTGTPGLYLDVSPKNAARPIFSTPFLSADGVASAGYDGAIYFTDVADNRVFFLAPNSGSMGLVAGDGSAPATPGNGAATNVGISSPTGVGVFQFGLDITSMHQLSNSGSLVQYVNLSSGISTWVGPTSESLPQDISIEPDFGDGYYADSKGVIRKTDGTVVAGGGATYPPPADDPKAGVIGVPSDVALIDASTGKFLFSTYDTGDQVGKVYLVENADTAEDQITLVAADLSYAASIFYLADGGFLAYDGLAHQIVRYASTDLSPGVTGVVGNGTAGIADPGTPANAAKLATDGDMTVTSEGLVFTQGSSGVIQMVPATAITDGPEGLTNSRTANFALASWDDNAAYQCTLDSQPPVTCTSGEPFDDIPDGPHTMSVKATTNGGTTADATAAVRSWTVDATPPSAIDLVAPADQETTGATTFSWKAATDDGPGDVRYEFFVDGTKSDAAPACADGSCSVNLNLPDGAHTWQVKAFDDAGNVRASATRAFTMHQPPTASLTISPNPALAGRTVTFDASKSSDTNGQITNYAFDLDGDGSFETDTGSSASTTKTFATPTTVQLQVRVTDSGGNTAVAGGKLTVTAVPPRNKPLGVSINDGAQYTNDPKVTIFSVWPSFASDAFVSNDGGFKNGQTFPVAEQIPWTLDSSGPERLPKTIYVRFESGPTTSETYQDDIILDQTPPKVVSASLTSGGSSAARAAAAKKVTLKLKATDNVSGVAAVQVTGNKRKPGKALKYKKTLKVKPAKQLYVRARDKAGNFSPWRTAKKR